MDSIIFVTGNKNKVKEAQSILGFHVEISDVEVEEIQDLDVEKVVYHKAVEAFEIVKKPLIVDDAGLYVDAWNGFPGALVKHLDKTNGLEIINKWLSLEGNRKVKVVAAIGYHDGTRITTFTGELEGAFVEPHGEHGWGFDPFILPLGHDKTWGEMDSDEKNAMSHRKQALEKFKEYLKQAEK